MAKRKYITEFAINMHLTHNMVLQQEDLKHVGEMNYFSEHYPCHIYLIARRPRVLVSKEGFKVQEDRVLFEFKIQTEDKYEDISIEIHNEFGSNNLVLNSDYPFNHFELLADGKPFWKGKSILLLQLCRQYSTQPILNAEFLDLEILYIGQSYGVEGARTAPERLQAHSTLQGIYSEAISRNPDREIWLMLTSFEQILLTNIDGKMKIDSNDLEKDSEHVKNVTKTVLFDGLNEQQVINFTEAALIRYFEPTYNKEYKNTFPNPAHKTYSQCYDLDINAVSIEFDTQNIGCRVYSDLRERKWWHMHDFHLHSKEERIGIFDYDSYL